MAISVILDTRLLSFGEGMHSAESHSSYSLSRFKGYFPGEPGLAGVY